MYEKSMYEFGVASDGIRLISNFFEISPVALKLKYLDRETDGRTAGQLQIVQRTQNKNGNNQVSSMSIISNFYCTTMLQA
jgi:hypothetical protein